MECIFCKIGKKQLPSVSVYEDEDSMAFLELNPSSPGHLMVILKKHGDSILEYSQDELGKLMETVKKVSKKVEKALGTDSLTLGINHHEKRGVPHLHMHVVPRWENDGGGIIQSIVQNKPEQDRETVAEKIRSVN